MHSPTSNAAAGKVATFLNLALYRLSATKNVSRQSEMLLVYMLAYFKVSQLPRSG